MISMIVALPQRFLQPISQSDNYRIMSQDLRYQRKS